MYQLSGLEQRHFYLIQLCLRHYLDVYLYGEMKVS